MSAFYIDGSLQVPDAELSAVAGHHVVTASEWLRPRVQGIVEELRQRRADAATQRLVVERLQAVVERSRLRHQREQASRFDGLDDACACSDCVLVRGGQ